MVGREEMTIKTADILIDINVKITLMLPHSTSSFKRFRK